MLTNYSQKFIDEMKPMIIKFRQQQSEIHNFLEFYLTELKRKDLLKNKIFILIRNEILSCLPASAKSEIEFVIEINKQLAEDYEFDSVTAETMRNNCHSETVDLASWPIPIKNNYAKLEFYEASCVIDAFAAYQMIKAGY